MDSWAASSRRVLEANLDTDPFAAAVNASAPRSRRTPQARNPSQQQQQPERHTAGVDADGRDKGEFVDAVTTEREAKRRGWLEQAPPEFLI
jgi:hypothetical protein